MNNLLAMAGRNIIPKRTVIIPMSEFIIWAEVRYINKTMMNMVYFIPTDCSLYTEKHMVHDVLSFTYLVMIKITTNHTITCFHIDRTSKSY